MSIIQAVITDNFCLMSGDSRATYSNNNTCKSGFNKVIKLNNQILFGVTGNPIHCFKLFDGYCFYDTKKGFVNSDKEFDDLSYIEFIGIITSKFYKMLKEHIEGISKYELGVIICGYNGKRFEITSFSIGSNFGVPNGINVIHKADDFPYKCAMIGLSKHINKFEILTNELHEKYLSENFSIRQFKNIMQEVVDDGSKFDYTIDNKLNFETIRKLNKNDDIIFK